MKYAYRFKVRLHDVDHAGVMFFARLFVHAHDAYEDFMAGKGMAIGDLIAQGVRLPIVHASADYLLPLRHDETIEVALEIGPPGQTSFTLNYKFCCGDELRARLQTVHVFIDVQSGLPATLPDTIRRQFLP